MAKPAWQFGHATANTSAYMHGSWKQSILKKMNNNDSKFALHVQDIWLASPLKVTAGMNVCKLCVWLRARKLPALWAEISANVATRILGIKLAKARVCKTNFELCKLVTMAHVLSSSFYSSQKTCLQIFRKFPTWNSYFLILNCVKTSNKFCRKVF